MGVIQPPWVTRKWFDSCPFNYCDHFGDKEELALMCTICKDEIERLDEYRNKGLDPYDPKNVFADVSKSFSVTLAVLKQDAKKHGIDLKNLPEVPEREFNPRSFKIYRTLEKYTNKVEDVIKTLELVPDYRNKILVMKAIEGLAHSRLYVLAKIHRAIESLPDNKDDLEGDLEDSKTSALLAHLAVERNSRIFFRLAKHKPLSYLRKTNLMLADISLEAADIIQELFFPNEGLDFEEFGCESFNKIFPPFGLS